MSISKLNLVNQINGYFVGAKATIEALTGVAEGALGYATDTNEPGSYDGAAWAWGSGAGAVSSVNGQTGVVSLDSDDISEGGSNKYVTGTNLWAVITGSGSATPADGDYIGFVQTVGGNFRKTLFSTFRDSYLRANLDTVYALTAKGVTNGDSHDHNGGDGAQINHTNLSNIGSTTHAAIDDFIASGWIIGAGTWSYSSADSPTFVISINADVTALIGVGDRIKLTQTTAKYFIVTAVGSYSGGATLVTVYGGTDYTLANAAITSPYYSTAKSPFGFPMDPDKWTVEVTDTTLRTQATPTVNVWYNNGSISISIPIGKWLVSYEVAMQSQKDTSSSAIVSAYVTLSNANNTELDKKWTAVQFRVDANTTAQIQVFGSVTRSNEIVAAAKTSYYLNEKTDQSTCANLYFRGDIATIVLRARSAYL